MPGQLLINTRMHRINEFPVRLGRHRGAALADGHMSRSTAGGMFVEALLVPGCHARNRRHLRATRSSLQPGLINHQATRRKSYAGRPALHDGAKPMAPFGIEALLGMSGCDVESCISKGRDAVQGDAVCLPIGLRQDVTTHFLSTSTSRGATMRDALCSSRPIWMCEYQTNAELERRTKSCKPQCS